MGVCEMEATGMGVCEMEAMGWECVRWKQWDGSARDGNGSV